MDAFEVNKIAGAVLSAMLVMATGKVLLDIGLKEHRPGKPGWALPETDVAHNTGQRAAPFEAVQVVSLLGKASPEGGQDTFKKCLACHTPDKGGRNLVGPNLWGVVGRKVGQVPGFNYSEVMKGHGGEWTWEQLATYLHDPRTALPGNKMAFVGVRDNAELADLLVYLRRLADTPAALPQ